MVSKLAIRLALACALLVAAGCGERAAAPPQAPPGAAPTAEVDLLTITPKPGREAEVEEFLRALATAARATDVRWTAHASVEREPASYVLVMRNVPRDREAWVSVAPGDVLERAFGAEEARRLLRLREDALEGLTRVRYAERRDLANAE